MGQINFTHKIIVNVDLLGAVAAGLIRGVNDNLFHKLMENVGGQCFRLYVAANNFEEAFDIHGLPLDALNDLSQFCGAGFQRPLLLLIIGGHF